MVDKEEKEKNIIKRMWEAVFKTNTSKAIFITGIGFFLFLLVLLIYGHLFLTPEDVELWLTLV